MERLHAESVADDCPCAQCGYSLRTLRLDGVCPECGLPVARSLLHEKDQAILAAEDRLLARLPEFERWRKRLGAMAAFGILTFAIMYVGNPLFAFVPEGLITALVVVAGSGFVLGILAALGWYGCRVRCQHGEYVRTARRAGHAMRTGSERRLDDRIAGREQAYAANSGCAKVTLVLFLLLIVSVPVVSIWASVPLRLPETAIMMLAFWLFWAIVMAISIWSNDGRLAHARSIRYSRRLGRSRPTGTAAAD